jgi:hypothetical protein
LILHVSFRVMYIVLPIYHVMAITLDPGDVIS